jgi:beta-galactosidase
MIRYGMKYNDIVQLYGKYVGNWGGEATVWRFDGIKNGEVRISRTLAQSCRLHLEVKASNSELKEKGTYDMSLIRIRVLDEYDNPAPYAQFPVRLKAEGSVKLMGPEMITLEGGCGGCFIASTSTGKGTLEIKAEGLESKVVEFEVGE